MEKGKLSVIIPIYNAQSQIECCVQSICRQTYKNIEIILVDDGSSDGSFDLCQKLAQSDERIKAIHQENQGASAARNTGLEIMQGEYLAFVDADDFLVSQSIYEEVINAFNSKPEVDMVVFNWETFDTEKNSVVADSHIGDSVMTSSKAATLIADNFSTECGGGYPWNKVFRAERIFDGAEPEFLFNTDLFVYEDKLFVLQCLSKCRMVQTISTVGYRYCVFPNSISHDVNRRGKMRKNVVYALEIAEDFYRNIDKKVLREIKKNKNIAIIAYTSDARISGDYQLLEWLWSHFKGVWKAVFSFSGLSVKQRLAWLKNFVFLLPNAASFKKQEKM